MGKNPGQQRENGEYRLNGENPPKTGESTPIKLHAFWMTLVSQGAHFPPTWNSFPSLKELRVINILFTSFRIIIIYYSLGFKLLSLAPPFPYLVELSPP
jgi:hypothetical protein